MPRSFRQHTQKIHAPKSFNRRQSDAQEVPASASAAVSSAARGDSGRLNEEIAIAIVLMRFAFRIGNHFGFSDRTAKDFRVDSPENRGFVAPPFRLLPPAADVSGIDLYNTLKNILTLPQSTPDEREHSPGALVRHLRIRFSRVRLSDKTSGLRPREATSQRLQLNESQRVVEVLVREASWPRVADLVLVT